ncbi:MAG: hypothetical protein K6F00_06945 [Lachnospiraceae bacterium]|nr:hypothetical protein [Lachnospiraceae bacterium]
MGAQEETEEVLRELLHGFQEAKPYQDSDEKVIVNKEEIKALLKRLNDCIISIMDEHEVSAAGRERAERAQKRKQDDLVKETKSNAADIYAAAMMYTDHALDEVNEITKAYEESMEKLHTEFKEKLDKQKEKIRKNKSELKVSLMNLEATDKYLKLIEDENARIAKEKAEEGEGFVEKNPYADIKPEIKINPAYFKAQSDSLEGEDYEDF